MGFRPPLGAGAAAADVPAAALIRNKGSGEVLAYCGQGSAISAPGLQKTLASQAPVVRPPLPPGPRLQNKSPSQSNWPRLSLDFCTPIIWVESSAQVNWTFAHKWAQPLCAILQEDSVVCSL
jgi:hypothetical protein